MEDYLESFLTDESLATLNSWSRVECCGSSRFLYCSECCKLLVPSLLQEHQKPLPFELHAILHDARKSATSLHAKVFFPSQTLLVDIQRGDRVPDNYNDDSAALGEGTFLLFPSADSVPLASVVSQISTLVVLDCKWTRSSSRDHPYLAKLPRVHLTNPSPRSFSWRWHNEGEGRLSTIEAIYEAAAEVDPSDDWLPILSLFG